MTTRNVNVTDAPTGIAVPGPGPGRPRVYDRPMSVRLTPDTRAAVDQLARENRWTPADTVRYLVEQALAAQRITTPVPPAGGGG